MVKCLKPGKVVVVLSGKYAGKKAVIVRVNENGSDKHKFPYAVVVGVERAPRKVTRSMSEKTLMPLHSKAGYQSAGGHL